MLYKREPQTQILTAGHWSREFLTFAVSGKCRKTTTKRLKKKRHQVSSSTSDKTCIVKTEEDGVNLKNEIIRHERESEHNINFTLSSQSKF